MMKHHLLALCLLIAAGAFAQNDSLVIPVARNQTLLEQTLNSTGFLLKKEVIPAGNLRGFTFDVLKVSNLENFQTVAGVRITQDYPAGTMGKQATSLNTDINKTFTNLYINDIDTLIGLLQAAKSKF